jgi:hypothetical protein
MYKNVFLFKDCTLHLCMLLKDKKERSLKTVKTHVVDIIDEHGVVVDSNTTQIKFLAGSKEEFFLMYASFLVYLKRSPDLKVALFAALCQRYADGKEFVMGRIMKDIIAEECKCSSRSLDVAFTNLIKEELVVATKLRRYCINPRYVFKGYTNARDAHYKMLLELSLIK